MDRINKFLNARQQKNQKSIKYKNEKFTIKKEDLKLIRAYKAGKCLDPSIKSIPNRSLTFSTEPVEATTRTVKKDCSEHFNRKLLEHYAKHPIKKVIEINKNEIYDIYETEGLEDLKEHTQEYTYLIEEQYEGKVEDLIFSKKSLEEEVKRIYMKYFKPRDLKCKPIRSLLIKLPKLEHMKPFPESSSFEYFISGKKTIFGSIVCAIEGNRLIVKELKYNHLLVDYLFEENVTRIAYNEGILVVSTKYKIFRKDCNTLDQFTMVINSSKVIKDIYIDKTFIGLLTNKSIHLYDCNTYEEIKILKLKGDTPHSIKISKDVVYSSTHKGIMLDSVEKSEIKNLGYVIDFQIGEDLIFVINNLGRLVVVDCNLKIVGNTVQSGLGSQIRYHPKYNLLAILFTGEIGFYKVIETQCIPLNTIQGSFRSISWDEEMPWLYAGQKHKVVLLT